MKKKIVVLLTGILAASMMLAGCEGSKGLETDSLNISQYKGVEVDQVSKPDEITDKDVEDAIQATLQTNATTNDITDRAVKSGDTVNIDFVGKIDGVEFEGGSGTDYPLTIGSGQFIEGFVKTVSEKSKNVKEYKKEVKKQLEDDAQTTYKDTLTQKVWQKVLDNTKVKKYPKKKVKEISDSLVEQYKTAAEYYQTDYETFLKEQMGSSVEDFEAQVDEAAKSSVKQQLVTDAIADKEKIKMDDKEYEKQLKKIADAYGYEDIKAVKEAASEEDLKEIALNNMVKEWLTEHCVQVASK